MYRIKAERVVDGDAADLWRVATNVDGWPMWDPHEQDARLEGPFVVGALGWSKPRGGPATWWTVTVVDEGRSWGSACPLPGGGLTGLTTFEPVGASQVRCRKVVTVTGPLTVLFRVWFGPRMRRDMVRSLLALGAEAGRTARLQ